MTLMTLPRSVSAGGRRSKQSRHSLDRRNGRERLPIQPDDPSGSSRGRGRGSRKKASGKFIIKKSHTNKDMKILRTINTFLIIFYIMFHYKITQSY